jgi:multimeric flavodoxin WrbA
MKYCILMGSPRKNGNTSKLMGNVFRSIKNYAEN